MYIESNYYLVSSVVNTDCVTVSSLANWAIIFVEGHGDRVVTLSPPTSEIGVHFPARPQVGKLVVACCWSAVYSTEP